MVREVTKRDIIFDNEFRSQGDFLLDLSNKYNYLGYFINSKLVSFVDYFVFADECEIHYVVTNKKYQNQGYADLLIDELIKINRGKRIFLEVNENNKAATNLYLKHGFEIINRREQYYGDADALIMQKEG